MRSLLLYKEFDLSVSIDEVAFLLTKMTREDFTIKRNRFRQYRFMANLSHGTFDFLETPGNEGGIGINAYLYRKQPFQTTVILESSLRYELLVIGLSWLVFTFLDWAGIIQLPWWVNALLIPSVLLAFWIAYRLQEKWLMRKVESYFRRSFNHKRGHNERKKYKSQPL